MADAVAFRTVARGGNRHPSGYPEAVGPVHCGHIPVQRSLPASAGRTRRCCPAFSEIFASGLPIAVYPAHRWLLCRRSG